MRVILFTLCLLSLLVCTSAVENGASHRLNSLRNRITSGNSATNQILLQARQKATLAAKAQSQLKGYAAQWLSADNEITANSKLNNQLLTKILNSDSEFNLAELDSFLNEADKLRNQADLIEAAVTIAVLDKHTQEQYHTQTQTADASTETDSEQEKPSTSTTVACKAACNTLTNSADCIAACL